MRFRKFLYYLSWVGLGALGVLKLKIPDLPFNAIFTFFMGLNFGLALEDKTDEPTDKT